MEEIEEIKQKIDAAVDIYGTEAVYQKEDGLVFLRVYVPEGEDSEDLGDSIARAIRTTNYQIDSTHSSQFFDVYLPSY